MEWISIMQYLPGSKTRDMDSIIVQLSNGERHFLNGGESILGTWLARDGKTLTRVTHWMELTPA